MPSTVSKNVYNVVAGTGIFGSSMLRPTWFFGIAHRIMNSWNHDIVYCKQSPFPTLNANSFMISRILRTTVTLVAFLSSVLLTAQDQTIPAIAVPAQITTTAKSQTIVKGASNNDYFKLELGFSAMFLGADQGATKSIFLPKNDTAYVTGSSFFGAQSGLSVRANFELGANKRINIPVGIDYTFFSGSQRLPSATIIQHGNVSVNVLTLVAGGQYRLVDLPLANAFLYAGAELRESYCPGPRFIYEESDTLDPKVSHVVMDSTLKSDVFRFGGALRFGCQGELSDALWINVNVAYGINNLLGRDDRSSGPERRGQLLTPSRVNETNEAFSKFLQFGIWLQYRL